MSGYRDGAMGDRKFCARHVSNSIIIDDKKLFSQLTAVCLRLIPSASAMGMACTRN